MYWRELGNNWQALLAASLGMGLGSALTHYTMSLFGPPLIAEFGWDRADFALLGTVPIVSMIFVPFAGRFVDRFGTRLAAIIGFTAVPLGYLGYAAMSGSLLEFFAIYVAQQLFGMLTTSMVFCRIVVERFDRARGIALSLVLTAPPLAGVIAPPWLSGLIGVEGWRAGFVAMAAVTAIGGLLAILTMRGQQRDAPAGGQASKLSWAELKAVLRHPTLLLIVGGMFLVNIPQIVSSSQLMLVAMDSGAGTEAATLMVSLYAVGVIVGRFLSGLALDRMEPHLVAIAALGLPSIGYIIFALPVTELAALYVAISLIGLAQGAESDVGAVLISRRFDMKNFSMLLSIVMSMIGAGSVVGSLILSVSLRSTDSYAIFLTVSAVSTLLGALLFGLTGTARAKRGTSASVERATVEQAMAGEIG